jgi:hypothetical protein
MCRPLDGTVKNSPQRGGLVSRTPVKPGTV